MPQATFPLVQLDAYRWEIPPTARPGMRVPGIIYADASLARFQAEWDRYLRAELPVKNDSDVTDEDIATKHLILFGDPGSNTLICMPRIVRYHSAERATSRTLMTR